MNVPAGLAFDAKGKLYETNFGNGQLYMFNPAKKVFASGFTSPDAITVASTGNIFVTDSGVGTIYQFTAAGMKTTFLSGFSQPTGLVFDSVGNLYVADNTTGVASKIAPNGTKTTFATGFVNPQNLAIERSTGVALNTSTRANVSTGDNVLIGGFIVQGTESKKVLVRGIGPSLEGAGVTGFLADPTLELHEPGGEVVANDNWRDTQEQEIIDTTIPPQNDLEAALVATLAPGGYTVILAGKDGE